MQRPNAPQRAPDVAGNFTRPFPRPIRRAVVAPIIAGVSAPVGGASPLNLLDRFGATIFDSAATIIQTRT